MKRKITLYYCEKCPAWRGSNKECPTCKTACTLKELPNRRAGMYFIDQVDRPLPSVTKILGEVIAKPQLTYWLKQEVAKACLEDPSISLAEAINAPDKIRDKAATKGSDIHKIIEAGAGGTYDSPWKEYIEAYRAFCSDFRHTLLLKEETVYNRTLGCAGTIDALVELATGEKILLDYKTSKNVYPKDYALQLSAYKLAMEEMGIKVDRMAVLHLKPDKTYSFIELPYVPNEWQAVLTIYQFLI